MAAPTSGTPEIGKQRWAPTKSTGSEKSPELQKKSSDRFKIVTGNEIVGGNQATKIPTEILPEILHLQENQEGPVTRKSHSITPPSNKSGSPRFEVDKDICKELGTQKLSPSSTSQASTMSREDAERLIDAKNKLYDFLEKKGLQGVEGKDFKVIKGNYCLDIVFEDRSGFVFFRKRDDVSKNKISKEFINNLEALTPEGRLKQAEANLFKLFEHRNPGEIKSNDLIVGKGQNNTLYVMFENDTVNYKNNKILDNDKNLISEEYINKLEEFVRDQPQVPDNTVASPPPASLPATRPRRESPPKPISLSLRKSPFENPIPTIPQKPKRWSNQSLTPPQTPQLQPSTVSSPTSPSVGSSPIQANVTNQPTQPQASASLLTQTPQASGEQKMDIQTVAKQLYAIFERNPKIPSDKAVPIGEGNFVVKYKIPNTELYSYRIQKGDKIHPSKDEIILVIHGGIASTQGVGVLDKDLGILQNYIKGAPANRALENFKSDKRLLKTNDFVDMGKYVVGKTNNGFVIQKKTDWDTPGGVISGLFIGNNGDVKFDGDKNCLDIMKNYEKIRMKNFEKKSTETAKVEKTKTSKTSASPASPPNGDLNEFKDGLKALPRWDSGLQKANALRMKPQMKTLMDQHYSPANDSILEFAKGKKGTDSKGFSWTRNINATMNDMKINGKNSKGEDVNVTITTDMQSDQKENTTIYIVKDSKLTAETIRRAATDGYK